MQSKQLQITIFTHTKFVAQLIASLKIIPPPPTPIGYPQGIPMVLNLEDKAKVESDPAKLISDDSSSDAEDIDIEN